MPIFRFSVLVFQVCSTNKQKKIYQKPVNTINFTGNHFFLSSFPIGIEIKSKKRVCTSFTTPKNNNGWIEIDVRQVIRHWEKAYRANTSSRGGQTINDPVLTIDVEDQDQNQLKAGLYFEPTDCQACKCAVFRLYFDLTN